jgi:hypothetical protein
MKAKAVIWALALGVTVSLAGPGRAEYQDMAQYDAGTLQDISPLLDGNGRLDSRPAGWSRMR